MIPKTYDFDYALKHIEKKGSLGGYSADGVFALLDMTIESPPRYSVWSNKRQIVVNTKNEIKDALMQLSFVPHGSKWFEPYYYDTGGKPGYIYLIRLKDTKLFKIGRTKNYPARIKAFSVEFPIGIEILSVHYARVSVNSLETLLHQTFLPYHKNGEWFELTDQDVQHYLGLMDFCERAV